MLIEKIYADLTQARKNSDVIAKNLLGTLYSEASRVGKDKRNGASTDEEVVATVKKFIANAEETKKLLEQRNQDAGVQVRELGLLQAYMPTQLTEIQLRDAVAAIIGSQNLSGPKAMGQVMAELKKDYSGSYDGKLASQIVKQLLG